MTFWCTGVKLIPIYVCGEKKQDIIHLLYECLYATSILGKLEENYKKYNIQCDFELINVLFDTVCNGMHVCNLVNLMYKQYMYRCKCFGHKPEYEEFFRRLRDTRLLKFIMQH